MSADPPRTIAGYTIQQRIAVGGMAEIYRGVRAGPFEFQKPVAIKMVLPDLARDPQFVEMFLQEARLAAQLSSPRLVQVFDFGEEAGTYYMVMEHVDGLDLAALLSAIGPLPVPVALHVARELCGALADLHAALGRDGQPLHIVHRDVNPGNVLLSRAGDGMLGDFGIAKDRARAIRTEGRAIKGKLAYLSPEQVRGDELDRRTDLYGVGLILFECLTGVRYLAAESGAEHLRIAANPPPRAPSSLRQDSPAALDPIVARALALDPAQRYSEARHLDETLVLVATGDAAEHRRRLAELVVSADRAPRGRSTASAPSEEAAPSQQVSAPPDASRDVRALSPKTELLASAAASSGRRWPWVAGLGTAALAAAAVGASWLWSHSARPPALLADASTPALAPPARPPSKTTPLDRGPARDASLTELRPAPRPAGARPLPRFARGDAAPPDRRAPPLPDARSPSIRDVSTRARERLREVERVLAEKGVLPEEASAGAEERGAQKQGQSDSGTHGRAPWDAS